MKNTRPKQQQIYEYTSTKRTFPHHLHWNRPEPEIHVFQGLKFRDERDRNEIFHLKFVCKISRMSQLLIVSELKEPETTSRYSMGCTLKQKV